MVPGCFVKQPGKVCRFFPFLPPFFHSYIITMYLGSLAAIRSSQGGRRSDALGGCGFCSVAARVAAWGAVYGLPRSAGVVFGPWLLCKAARGGLWSAALGRPCLQVRLSVSGCSRGSQGSGLRCAMLGKHGFRSLAALRSSRERFIVPFPSALFFLFVDTNHVLRLPGCNAKDPG